MKKIENLLLKACGYTLLILVLFYVVAMIGKLSAAAIDFPTFALIFVFGVIISAANLVLYTKLKTVFKVLIHYAVLLISFSIIFILAGKLNTGGSSVIFTAIVVFTFLYGVIFAIAYFVRRAVISADKSLNKLNEKKGGKNSKKPYTPRYK